ncbi:MAG: tetratricopeptide repeat-containing glycosyltransferase family protein [Betaproteobacteria bacterium]
MGVRMERALSLQMAGRADDAADEYRAVIALASDTHDALHMLSVIELNRGEIDEAERLIDAALALRPAYAAIEHNRLLVSDARLARARAQPEQLAERALPILADLALGGAAHARTARASRGARTHGAAAVHLIGRAHAGNDDDDGWLLERLATLLDAGSTTVWAVDGDGTDVIGTRRVERVDPGTGWIPRGGIHVFAGVDFDASAWLDRADAERVLVFCQGAAPTRYLEQLRALSRDGARSVELVFPSRRMAQRFGSGHTVLPPPVDLLSFTRETMDDVPAYDEWVIERPPDWPVGIVGQNPRAVTEPHDADFIRALAGVAGRLDIYDPGRFRYLLGGNPATRFHPRRAGGQVSFLESLACFVHRTQSWWTDTLGRELYGAMAQGIPVLCPRDSIHAERIEHGVDGFLYASFDEAQHILVDLRRAPALAAAVGEAARARARSLFDAGALARRYRDVVSGAAPVAPETMSAARVA